MEENDSKSAEKALRRANLLGATDDIKEGSAKQKHTAIVAATQEVERRIIDHDMKEHRDHPPVLKNRAEGASDAMINGVQSDLSWLGKNRGITSVETQGLESRLREIGVNPEKEEVFRQSYYSAFVTGAVLRQALTGGNISVTMDDTKKALRKLGKLQVVKEANVNHQKALQESAGVLMTAAESVKGTVQESNLIIAAAALNEISS